MSSEITTEILAKAIDKTKSTVHKKGKKLTLEIQEKKVKFEIIKKSASDDNSQLNATYGRASCTPKKYVNFEDKSIHIAYTLDNTSVREQERKLNSPKTYSSIRDVALNQRCVDIIKYFIDTDPNEEFVFVNECGNIMVANTVSKHLKKICTDVLGEGRYFLHMLRHSHISMLIEMGLPLRSIMDRVGHKNEKITLQIYSHVTKKMRETMQEKLEEINL